MTNLQPPDRPSAPTVLVGVDFGSPNFDGKLEELGLLAQTAGLTPVARLTCKRKAPDAALFVGSGKADEIKQLAAQLGAVEILFDQSLSPAQQRNLERQSGGIGMRGGPGETQIELDRRMINDNIKKIKERLVKVKRQRQTQRRQRERRDAFNISLVGYTNAGKTTLFNALVKARAYAADQLFATLDTTTRQLYLGEAARSVSLSDTVGFIRDLPHGLIDAFQATLQEAVDADLLLHVVDAASPNCLEQMAEVQRVLREIGAADIPQVLVFNKLDALDAGSRPLQLEDSYDLAGVQTPRIFLSAAQGEGLDLLRARLAAIVSAGSPGLPQGEYSGSVGKADS